MSAAFDIDRIHRLPCWRGAPVVSPLSGGMTNRNFQVQDAQGRHVVRLGEDVPHHGIDRAHELAVSRAAHAAGLSPEIEYAEPGAVVMQFIEGTTLTPHDVRQPDRLETIAALIRRCHWNIPSHLDPTEREFCPFNTVRRYSTILHAQSSPWCGELDELLDWNRRLEGQCPSRVLAFGHNDLLAGNLIDDGRRLWLIDWDYAAYSRPLFDLANLATNNELEPDAEAQLVSAYLSHPPDDETLAEYRALRVASLLRETLWSMVSELHPAVEFDYRAYTRSKLERLRKEWNRFAVGG